MYHGTDGFWKHLLNAGLREDDWQWDWTTLGALKTPEQSARARIIAKCEGIWAAQGLARTLASTTQIECKSPWNDGAPFKAGDILAEWAGPAREILAYERGFLNLASYAGGIATQTRRLVDAVRKACPERTPRIAPTRKTLPLYRDLAIHAVIVGGGHPHRTSLAGGVLIKENHVKIAGNLESAIRGARAKAPHGLKIEAEVRDETELKQALTAGADAVLLDNFTPEQVRAALKTIERLSPARPTIEVSGGITPANAAEFAIPGVDVLSSGALTHSVRALDLSLLVV